MQGDISEQLVTIAAVAALSVFSFDVIARRYRGSTRKSASEAGWDLSRVSFGILLATTVGKSDGYGRTSEL